MKGEGRGTKHERPRTSYEGRGLRLAPRPSPLAPLSWPVLWLALACVACLAPFLNKAFHIDDTLFVYAAQQIQKNPLDFYGFHVNWYGVSMPMGGDIETPRTEGVMQNPPLASYYLALAAALLGWSEPALHLAFLLPAIAVVWGAYRLGQRLCTRPAIAALATLLTPAFLVSSTNVMCDTLTLAFWVWTVVLWESGLRRRQMGWLFLAAVLISLTALSKYIGVALIPLLVAYTFAYQWNAGKSLRAFGKKGDCPPKSRGQPPFFPNALTDYVTPCLPLVLPIFVLFEYQQFTAELYGHGLLSHAVGYAAAIGSPINGVLGGLSFLGGSVASVLFFTPALWSRRQLLIGLALVALIVIAVGLVSINGMTMKGLSFGWTGDEARVPWLGIVQYAILTTGGLGLAVLTCLDFWNRRDAGSVLLVLWIGGMFVFATLLNWTLNVRSLLPLLPAAGIVIARRLDRRLRACCRRPMATLCLAARAGRHSGRAGYLGGLPHGERGPRGRGGDRHGQREPSRKALVPGSLGISVLHGGRRRSAGRFQQVSRQARRSDRLSRQQYQRRGLPAPATHALERAGRAVLSLAGELRPVGRRELLRLDLGPLAFCVRQRAAGALRHSRACPSQLRPDNTAITSQAQRNRWHMICKSSSSVTRGRHEHQSRIWSLQRHLQQVVGR